MSETDEYCDENSEDEHSMSDDTSSHEDIPDKIDDHDAFAVGMVHWSVIRADSGLSQKDKTPIGKSRFHCGHGPKPVSSNNSTLRFRYLVGLFIGMFILGSTCVCV